MGRPRKGDGKFGFYLHQSGDAQELIDAFKEAAGRREKVMTSVYVYGHDSMWCFDLPTV